MLKVKKTKKYGRGVYSTSKIRKNSIFLVNEILLVSEKDIKNSSILINYWYEFNSEFNCIALGLGSLFNHSENPNIFAQVNKKKKTITFKALRDIKLGEQLFLNYGYAIT